MESPPSAPSSQKPQADEPQGRRFREALRYVSRTWMPVNPGVLKVVQKRFKEGHYRQETHLLQTDLKSDFSLYTHCLRKLEPYVPEERKMENPLTILSSLEDEQIKEILLAPEGEMSHHRIDDLKQVQAQRIRHSLISCGSAEVLAHRSALDPDLAFLSAMLRQLGFMLVAWNYPSSFQQALAAVVVTGEDIEVELEKIIGFPPSRLGVEAALHWSKHPELLVALGVEIEKQGEINGFLDSLELTTAKRNGGKMARLCELGETIAQVANPEHYPQAIERWYGVEKEVSDILGAEGLSLIHHRVTQLSQGYVRIAPDVFNVDVSPEKLLRKTHAQFSTKLFNRNVYAKKCSPEEQELFKKVYEQIIPGMVSSTGINTLVSDVIPKLGFLRGCVYMLDSKAMLVPKLRIGNNEGRTYRPTSASVGEGKSNPIAEALHCSTPLKQESVILHDEVVSHVSGKYGNADKRGVLYLEMSKKLLQIDPHVPVLYFKAVRQCLDDCLNLH